MIASNKKNRENNGYMGKMTLILICFLTISFSGFGATYYSRVASGSFTAVGSWSINQNGIPTNATALQTTDIFIIQTGNNISVPNDLTASSITVLGTLTIGATLVLTAPVTVNSGGTLLVNTARLTLGSDLVNNQGGTVTVTTGRLIRTTQNITNGGSITMGAGQFTNTSGDFTNTSTGTFVVTGTLNTLTLGLGDLINSNPAAGSVNFGSTAVTISGTQVGQTFGSFTTTALFSCTKSAGDLTLTGNVNSSGLTKSGAGTLNMGSGTHTFSTAVVTLTAGVMNGGSSTINVNFVSATAWNGTATVFVPQTSTVNFGAAGAQTISATGTRSFNNLTYSNSGLKTNTACNVSGTFTLQGTATASAAPTYTGTVYGLRYNTSDNRNAGAEWPATFDGSGGVTIATSTITVATAKVFSVDDPLTINTGATLTTGSSAFSFGGDFTNTGTWTNSTGPVTINLARTSQVIGKFTTTGLVSFTKPSGTATLTGIVLGGAFTMNGAGTLNMGAGFTHDFSGLWTNTAGTLEGNTSTLNMSGTTTGTGVTFTPGTSTVNFDANAAQLIPAFTYHNLQTSTGNTKTLSGNTTVNGVLQINASNTLTLSDKTLTLAGTGTPFVLTGTFTPATGTVVYSGATSNVITSPTPYYNLQISGTQTMTGAVGVSNLLTVNNGATLALGALTLTLSGTGLAPLVLTGTGSLTPNTGTVLYSGASPTITGASYHNLTTATAGTKTLVGNASVSGILTNAASNILLLGSNTLTLSGSGTPISNSGTFTPETSTVIYSDNSGTLTNIATAGSITYNNLTTTGTAKTIPAGVTVSVGNDWDVSSPLTMTTTANVDVTRNIIGTGAITMGTTGQISLMGDWTNSGILVPGSSGSTVLFDGSGSQAIGANNYYNLTTSGGGTKTLAGDVSVGRVITIGLSTELNLSNRTLTLSGPTDPLVATGTFTASTSKVVYSTGTQNITLLNYYNLDCPAGAKTYPAGTIGIAGTFNPSGSTQTVDNANIVNFKGTDPTQAITGGFPFKKVILSGSGQKIISNTVGVSEVEIQDGPTMDITTGQLDIN